MAAGLFQSQLLCSANAFPAIRMVGCNQLPVKKLRQYSGMLQRVGMAGFNQRPRIGVSG